MTDKRQKTENGGQIIEHRCADRSRKMRGKASVLMMELLAIRLGWQTTPAKSLVMSPERGFTLIEMMISLTIGMVIVAALVGVLISNSQSAKTNDRTAELQSNGRYALNHLKRELHHAGYRGYTPAAPQSGAWVTPAITNECGTPLNFVKNIRQAVWGANDNNPFAGDCLSATNAKYDNNINSDVLVIRHASGTPTLAASALANTLYVRSSYANASVLQGSALPAAVITGTENFALQVYVYYIGSDDNDATVPALRRVALVGNAMVDQMVVSGIEQIQFEYGITNTAAGTTQYFTANNIPAANGVDHSANGPTSWDGVNSVRIWLLARNAKPETGYSNTNTYNMSNLVYGPVNDSFRRQVFTTVVQLRNFR